VNFTGNWTSSALDEWGRKVFASGLDERGNSVTMDTTATADLVTVAATFTATATSTPHLHTTLSY
jgi:hypothetical protein